MKVNQSIRRLALACGNEGTSIDALFNKPLPMIVAFASRHRVSLRQLSDIVSLLLRRLDTLEEQCARDEAFVH
jgi:hypothetical protein